MDPYVQIYQACSNAEELDNKDGMERTINYLKEELLF